VRFAFVVVETEASRRHVRERRADHRSRIEGWTAAQARDGNLLGGEAFHTQATGPVTLRRTADGGVAVTEGPFAAGEETLGGYLLIEAADRDEAVALAATWPTEETIEVRPIWSPA
jgi:hypothetical protein